MYYKNCGFYRYFCESIKKHALYCGCPSLMRTFPPSYLFYLQPKADSHLFTIGFARNTTRRRISGYIYNKWSALKKIHILRIAREDLTTTTYVGTQQELPKCHRHACVKVHSCQGAYVVLQSPADFFSWYALT